MQVHFKQNWFGPNLNLYRKCESSHQVREVPDEFLPLLPSTARVVKGSVGRAAVAVEFEDKTPDYEDELAAIDTITSAIKEHDRKIDEVESKRGEQLAEQAARAEAIRESRRANIAKARATRAANLAAKKGN